MFFTCDAQGFVECVAPWFAIRVAAPEEMVEILCVVFA